MAKLIKSISILRLCSEGAPLGRVEQRKRKGPTYEFEQEVTDESSNEQIVETNSSKRSQKKTIKTGRTYPFNRFVLNERGEEVDFSILNRSVTNELFGAWRSIIPDYGVNSVDRGKILATSYVSFEASRAGKIEAEPVEDMFQNNGWQGGTSWRYFEVLSELEGTLTVTNHILKLDKLATYVNKLNKIRIGPLHALRQDYGLVTFVEDSKKESESPTAVVA